MYEVLLAVDSDEERARAQAEAVADMPGKDEVAVTLFHVFKDNPEGASVSQLSTVRQVREVLEEAGIEAELSESSGNAAIEIVEHAKEIDADCICVSGRKRSPAGKALFGSTAQAVILDAERPVLVAPPQD
ncbi:universal stress protein [Haloarchaeobius sp. DYHT-AS-18]|uniref:universal stress protein n=1 Tax=Haloarchaeobius sp. DYHT-AS-18 TaxID=3446117 RepID=UPI003EBC2AF4